MMNIIGRKVSHVKFGEGEIVDQSGTSIKIEFITATKVLTYPGCFEKFVTFIDG